MMSPLHTTENRMRQAGMKNLGNTGYMEVILQTLYHCTEFRDFILSLDLSCMAPRDSDDGTMAMVEQLQRIFEEWYMLEHVLPMAEDPERMIQHDVLRVVYSHINPYIGPIGHVDPTAFVNAARKCIKLRFPMEDPNDAFHFYAALIRKLRYFSIERLPTASRLAFQQIFVTPQTTTKKCSECNAVLSEKPFPNKGGVAPYCFDCPVSSSQDQMVDQYHHHATPLLIQALREGDGGYGLHPSCSCSRDGPVTARVSRRPICNSLPTLLTIRFKRWPLANRNCYFEFDEFLDLTDLLEPEEQEATTLTYRLFSVIVHHGNHNGLGRYFSFIRSNDGTQWGRFWGTDVQPVDWETVRRESFGKKEEESYENGEASTEEPTNIGYMLFYEKMTAR